MASRLSALPDFFTRPSRIDDGGGKAGPDLEDSRVSGYHSSFLARSSGVSQIGIPSCCEYRILDILITFLCLAVLIVTVAGYSMILNEDVVDILKPDNQTTIGINNPLVNPIPWNESQVVDDNYHEFFLRCRTWRTPPFKNNGLRGS